MRSLRLAGYLAALALVGVPPGASAVAPSPVPLPSASIAVSPQGPEEAPPPPAHSALVHLKAGVCDQVASVSIKAGNSLVIIADGTAGSTEFHFPTVIWTGRLYATNWLYITPHTAGLHYTFTFGSSDCPSPTSPGLYTANATTVDVTVKKA